MIKQKKFFIERQTKHKITESAEVTNSTLVDQFLKKLETELKESANKSLLLHFADVRRDIAEVKKISERIKEQLKTTQKPGKSVRKKKVPPKVYLAKLPTTGHDLFGREKELKMLDKAWGDPHTSIVSLVAFGGVGKSALVNAWLNGMARDNYRGAERVYAWSFYSQGTSEERQVSADEFFADALEWFGYDGPPILSPWDKGKKLAELVRAQRTLIILDGLEPLQYPPGEMRGRLKDQGLQALLKDLARATPGLCVISTRLQVEDLEATVDHSSQRVFLENLSPKAGAELLKKLSVKGTQKEMKAVAEEYDGHALALNLLGNYLKAVHGGEIRKRDKIAKLTGLKKHQGLHARRVMASYETWFRGGAKLPTEAGLLKMTSSTEHSSPELNILYLMGLFDRPAEASAIAALRVAPEIKGLTNALQNLSDENWQLAVSNLRDLHLLATEEEARPDTLDCHPLMREHFGERLEHSNKEAWREAHNRLYDYYKTCRKKSCPTPWRKCSRCLLPWHMGVSLVNTLKQKLMYFGRESEEEMSNLLILN